MRKSFKYLLTAAMLLGTTTAAVAQDVDTGTAEPAKVEAPKSAHGSYKFARSWGIGVQYGMTYTQMTNWNHYLLWPNFLNYFDANFTADHELYIEVTPVEGFRLSAFGGWQTLYLKNTGYNYFYGGLEPAFSVRRSYYEFAVGVGIGYGQYKMDNKKAGDVKGHGLLVRPFVEGRIYPGFDYMALYLRVGFSLFKSFGLEDKDTWKGNNTWTKDNGEPYKVDKDKLMHAGPYAAAGLRFGYFPLPKHEIGDKDNDGIYDDVDECIDIPGKAEFLGCPSPDTDNDKVCDPWVARDGHAKAFAGICKGSDLCPTIAGSEEFMGCPNADADGDKICDPWVAENGMSEKLADTCKGSDKCPDKAEDFDGFEDEDGCPDADNDKDRLCDMWVAAEKKTGEYSDICKPSDQCPNEAGTEEFMGCPNPDSDGDQFCDEYVYKMNLQDIFKCKGLDQCPNEKGEDDKGCKYRRVEVTEKEIRINEKIFFALNKAIIKKESDSLLQEIAQVFNDNPQIKKVEIQGHTDFSGSAKRNMKLSNDRAKAVYDRLVKNGVDKSRMTYKGYGSTQPLIPKVGKKEKPEDAAMNRRVNFIILEQDTVKKVVKVTESGVPLEVKKAAEAEAARKKAEADAEAARKQAEAAKDVAGAQAVKPAADAGKKKASSVADAGKKKVAAAADAGKKKTAAAADAGKKKVADAEDAAKRKAAAAAAAAAKAKAAAAAAGK